ncbi:MAG: hypothetical protein ABW360_05000 [Phenylobacterium sp.]
MNVYRHAAPRQVTLRPQRRQGQLVLEVEDDGVCLPTGAEGRAIGVGIAGMHARMIQLGGAFQRLPGAAGLKVRASIAADAAPEP